MIKRRISRCFRALSPVVGTILVVLIVLTVTSTVMLWGLPYLADLRAQSQQSYIGSQFSVLDETFSSAITSGLGTIRENTITIEDGEFSFECDKSRAVISYSLLPGYNFSVTGLDPFNSSYDPKSFTLNMYEGQADKAEIFWITTRTPYGKFNSSLFNNEPSVVPNGSYTAYRVYNLTGYNKAWKINGSAIPYPPLDIEANGTAYTDLQYENVSSNDSKYNSWVGSVYPNKYAILMYRFYINQPLNSIEKINITWIGDDTLTEGGALYLYIWNITSSSWESLLGSNPVSNTPNLNETYGINYTSNFSNWISNSGYMYIAVVGGFKNSPPNKPSNPDPTNGASNVNTSPTLKVLVTDPDGDKMNVTFYGKKSSDSSFNVIGGVLNVANNSYASINWNGLERGTKYEWYVVVNDSYTINTSDTWNFTTSTNRPPYQPSNPSPPDNAEFVPIDVTLSWTGGDPDGDLVTYDVYFGMTSPPPYKTSTSNTWYSPGILRYSTTYYWKIIAKDNRGGITEGPIWMFITEPEPITTEPTLTVCCFPAGTKVMMADGILKIIEDIKIGDKILSYDIENCRYVTSYVTDNVVLLREGVYEINDGLISPTDDHPLYVKKKDGRLGWAAINPEKSKIAYNNRKVIMPLEVGDLLLAKNGEWIEIKSIKFRSGPIRTYTFTIDSDVHDYFANGVLVSNAPLTTVCGVECFPAGTLITMSDLTYKPIEEINPGDKLLSYNLSTKSYCISTVCSIEKPVRNYYTINNGLLNVTDNHPLYVKKSDQRECWAAIDPNKAKSVYGLDNVEKLEIGDRFYLENSSWSEEVLSIEQVEKPIQTYTLSLSGCNNFFANGVLAYSYPKELYIESIEHKNTLIEDYVEVRIYYNATDTQPPSTTITSTEPVLDNGVLYQPNIKIYWSGSDDQTPSDKLEYLYRLHPVQTSWLNTTSNNITFELKNEQGDPVPGDYIFYVRAVDMAGNVEAQTPNNTLAINFTIPPCSHSFRIVEPGNSVTLDITSSCPNCLPLKDFVLINFYNGDTLFGKTFIFDIDSLTYKLSTSSGYYASHLENGAILFEYNNYNYFYKKPTLTDENGLLCLRLIHTTTNNAPFSFAPRGKVTLQTILTGNTFRHSSNAYSLSVAFYGHTSKAWIDYLTKNYNFLLSDNNLLFYKNKEIRKFILSHSILEISVESIGG